VSQENEQVVRQAWTATVDEDWPAALTLFDDDVEIRDFDIPDAGIYRGHEGFVAWLSRWNESWSSWRAEGLEFRAAGDDRVIALFRMIATGLGSGIEIERDDAILYRLRDGKIVRVEYFSDQGQALEVAGLSE